MDGTIKVKINRLIIYTVIYTASFLLLHFTIAYILPFVLGAIIALIAHPFINKITRTFRIKRCFVAPVVVIIIFAVISTVIGLIIGKIISELMSLSSILPQVFENAKNIGYKYLDMAAYYYRAVDPAIVDSIKELANKVFSESLPAAMFVINSILKLIKSLPSFLMVILFTLLSSIYLAVDLPEIKNKFLSLFSKEDSTMAKKFLLEGHKMLGHYLSAYIILSSITFIETYIGTTILKLKYALIISAITAVADILPILGPGTILIPLGTAYMIGGNYFRGVGVFIIYLIILAVRQILEPKILSSSFGVHPLAIIIAIFIGLKAYGFRGMIFTVFFVIFYTILQKVGLL